MSNQGPSKGQSLQWFKLHVHKKTINILIHKCNKQTSNLQRLDWYISTKHIYVSDEYNIWKSPLGNYKKNIIINIYHLLIFNKLLTSSEHRNRNKPFYIYKGLIQWQKADPASFPSPMYMHESNAIHIQRSSRAGA